MKWKVCGNRDNLEEVAGLEPDYMGFIYWEPSSRSLPAQGVDLSDLPSQIKRVGVFVDESAEAIAELAQRDQLDYLQLHGKEQPSDIQQIKALVDLPVIKAFAPSESFDFDLLDQYTEWVDYFLFDTKGPLPGGNGYEFDWSLLDQYTGTTPYLLSGGIGLESLEKLEEFLRQPAAKHCIAIDINSKFEDAPGRKNISALNKFRHAIKGKI